jgi:hypothetical protein
VPVKIKKAEPSDAESFAKINEVIWGTPATESIIDYFTKGISLFRDGYYLAESKGVFVGSSEGFPIKEKIPISVLAEIEDPVGLLNLRAGITIFILSKCILSSDIRA